jgi:hypothetical protein
MSRHSDDKNATTNSMHFELQGWGPSFKNPGRRGGFWSRYGFDTLKEAKKEQKVQLLSQAENVAEKEKMLKKTKKTRSRELKLQAEFRFGSDHGHTFPIFKVTREYVP